MKNKFYILILLLIFCTQSYSQNFALIKKDCDTNISVGEREDKVVHTAIDLFCSDMESVSGKRPTLNRYLSENTILAGTIGKNEFIDKLIDTKRIAIKEIEGKWEAFQIQIINEGDKKILVIVGSDSRGTAYGILELSRLIGVSPWIWWADSTSHKKSSLDIPDDYFNCQKPSVQYRGIFLNDEDWGLMPWSSTNFEQSSQRGKIGSQTYAKIFELLLRLRANTIWPAMHESTVPFYFVEGNKETADKYGIVVGTSHCEPLMRNGAGEWDTKKYGDYNYLTNRNTVLNYWSERLTEAGKYENFYTIGMRGVHDGKMEGVKTLDEQTKVLSQVIKDQRDLLKKHVNRNVNEVPQSFVPYKEVLTIYENGLDVPEDVTLTWCDDNYGYITRLSNAEEQKRKGGAGVYYHVSYWGRPHDYLWLATTSPSQIYWQMKKAWETNTRKLWILNVGDIKPAEYLTEFFLDIAWNIDRVNSRNIYDIQYKWYQREFGEESARQISDIMKEYYRLATIRKPEFMGWSRVEEYSPDVKNGRTPVIDTEFNPYAFGDEIYMRLKDYSIISDKAQEIDKLIPQEKKSAYFQLVLYPVCASAEMNKKLLYAQKARLYSSYNLPVTNEYIEKSIQAYNAIAGLTYTYNHDLMKGKWNGIMDMKPRDLYVFQEAPLPKKIKLNGSGDILVWAENQSEPTKSKDIKLTPFVNQICNKTFVSLFNDNGKCIDWKIENKPEWLQINEDNLDLRGEKRLCFWVDFNKVTEPKNSDKCILSLNNHEYVFHIETIKTRENIPTEHNRMVIINISDYKSNSGNTPLPIEGLGYSTDALELPVGKQNATEYKIYTTSEGDAVIRTYMIPNHPVNGNDIRYAISVDGETPQIVSFKTEFRSETWKINVLRNQSVNISNHKLTKPGEHTITVYALDERVILDQMMLDFEAERKFYELPVNLNL